jgi:predicted PurR-regulated permease PerM
MHGPEPGQDAPPAQNADDPTPIWISPRLRTTLVIGAIALLILAIWRVPGILAIVIGGIALALVLSFPVEWLSRAMPRGIAILASLLFLIGLIAVGFAVLLPVTIDELTGLIAVWPNTQADLDRMLGDVARRIPLWAPTPEEAGVQPGWLREGVTNRVEAAAADLLGGLVGLASGTIGFVIQVVAAVTIAIYLLLDAQALRDGFVHLAPPRYRRDAAKLWDTFGISLSRYLRGVVVVAVVTGTLSSIALWALGVPYPLLLGGWVAFSSLIPVFGTYLGVAPALPLALAQSPTTAALTIVAYTVIQQVEANVLTPRVQSETANVPPAVVLLAVLWTGMAFGVFWSVLAVPALMAARVLLDFFRARLRVRTEHSRGRTWRTIRVVSRTGGIESTG